MREEERSLLRARSAVGLSRDGHISKSSELREFFNQYRNVDFERRPDNNEVAHLKIMLRESQLENKVVR